MPLTIFQRPESRYASPSATNRPGWPEFAISASAPILACPDSGRMAALKPQLRFHTTQATGPSMRPSRS